MGITVDQATWALQKRGAESPHPPRVRETPISHPSGFSGNSTLRLRGQSRHPSGVLGDSSFEALGPMLPIHQRFRDAAGPTFRSESQVPDATPAPGPPRRRAGGSPRGAPGIPGRPAAVVERVLMPLSGRPAEAGPGWGRGLAAREGPAGGAGPWPPQWPGPPPPAGLYTAAKFRLRPEFVPIRDAFPPPAPWPGPRARRVYKAWAGPAAARRAVPARPCPPAAPRCPKSRRPRVQAMALSEPILPSFSTFASPCRERGLQEVRAAAPRGRRLRAVERGLRGSRTQAAGTVGLEQWSVRGGDDRLRVTERRWRGLQAQGSRT